MTKVRAVETCIILTGIVKFMQARYYREKGIK